MHLINEKETMRKKSSHNPTKTNLTLLGKAPQDLDQSIESSYDFAIRFVQISKLSKWYKLSAQYVLQIGTTNSVREHQHLLRTFLSLPIISMMYSIQFQKRRPPSQ